MTKSYKTLAKHFVDLGETRRSEEEIIALLKSRVQRFETVPRAATAVAPVPKAA